MSRSSSSHTDLKPPGPGSADAGSADAGSADAGSPCVGQPGVDGNGSVQGNVTANDDVATVLDWRVLSMRFDEDVFDADFAGWIDNELTQLETRLVQFASTSTSTHRSR